MKRDLLTNSEQLAFPMVSRAVALVLSETRHRRVTPNMLKALAFKESGAKAYFECTGCGSVEKAAKRSAKLLGMPWQECARIATPTVGNDKGVVCKFETDEEFVNGAMWLAGLGTSNDKYRFVLASRWGMWMCPMMDWLCTQDELQWGVLFEQFISTPHVQALEAADRLARAFDNMDQVNTLLGFTRFRAGEACQRFNTYGASVEAIYRRLVRATGEL